MAKINGLINLISLLKIHQFFYHYCTIFSIFRALLAYLPPTISLPLVLVNCHGDGINKKLLQLINDFGYDFISLPILAVSRRKCCICSAGNKWALS